MFGPIENGNSTWIRVGEIDYELMGYLLSCHLIMEHYMDAFLKAHYPEFRWEAARLTFGQRVALLATPSADDICNPVEAIKHLNSLRNRLGHRFDYRLTCTDMLPFVHYLQRIADLSRQPPERPLMDEPPRAVLEKFILVAAAYFAGAVSRNVRMTCTDENAVESDNAGK
jgi:hypothetical protein